MKTVYKIFLVFFVIFIAIDLYMFNWNLGFFNSENAKFIIPLAAGIVGIFLVVVLNTWSKLSTSKR
jgi:hypothetical protein